MLRRPVVRGPVDHHTAHQLDLLREHEALTGSELAAITGLTTGAVTGVVARLEHAGHLRREPHPHDGRKQVLRPAPEASREIQELFEAIAADAAELVNGFDDYQLAAIAQYLARATTFARRRAAQLRARTLTTPRTEEPR